MQGHNLTSRGLAHMTPTFFSTGIYTVPEAARLTGVSTWRIRRWLRGYDFPTKRGRGYSPAVWRGQLEPIDHSMALGFLDLIEVRCVDALLEAGVSWPTLRRAHTQAKHLVGHEHPFCTNRFATDGRAVFMELCDEELGTSLWDIGDVQRVFEQIIQPFLKNTDFGDDNLVDRWWPRGKSHLVALDPRRSFGHPIIFRVGIPTVVLARSVQANGSVEEVARWFEVEPICVREAVEFEQSLAA